MADSPCMKNRSLKADGRLNRWSLKGKLHSKIISSDMISVESDGEGPRSKFEREDGQTDGGKTGTCEHL